MDDSMDFFFSEEECVKFYEELLVLWGFVGMYVRKWFFNLE